MQPPDFQPSDFGLTGQDGYTVDLADQAATQKLAATLAGRLKPGDFVGLVGALGAGKTTFVQGLVDALDGQDEATSPTYTLLNEYATEPPVVHVDLYRLETFDELETIAYWDYVESGRAITCVEWIDRMPQAWPGDGLLIVLEYHQGARRARMWADGSMRGVIAELDAGTPRG